MLLKQYAASVKPEYERIRCEAQDESRFGLKTLVGRLITSLGVKPLLQLAMAASLPFGSMGR